MTQPPSPEELGDSGDAASVPSGDELAGTISEIMLTSEELARTETELAQGATAEPGTAHQLDADRRVVEALAETGFVGEQFETAFRSLSSRLIRYAFPILSQWVRDGTIFRQSERYRTRIDPAAAAAAGHWTEHDRGEVVTETLVRAVEFFLDYGLRREKWDSRRGASLRTYFVGACVCQFISVCNERWKQQVTDEMHTLPEVPGSAGTEPHPFSLDSLPGSAIDPCALVALRDEAARAMAQIDDPDIRYVLARRMAGQTQAAAAEELGLTAKAVERRLHTQRKKLRPPNLLSNSEDEGRRS